MDLIKILAMLVVSSNTFLAFFLFAFVLKRLFAKDFLYGRIIYFLSGKELKFAFLVSLSATLGSLYLSEVRNFTPCLLCWYQRVFMYPLPIILGVAMYKKLKETSYFVLPLSAVGAVIALYHYYLQLTPKPLSPCTTIGFSVSCSERFFTYFGYITIPWMSFSAFLLVGILVFLVKSRKKGV